MSDATNGKVTKTTTTTKTTQTTDAVQEALKTALGTPSRGGAGGTNSKDETVPSVSTAKGTLLVLVSQAHPQSLSMKQLKAGLGALGHKVDTHYNDMNNSVEQGLVEKVGGRGNYSYLATPKLLALVSPTTAESEEETKTPKKTRKTTTQKKRDRQAKVQQEPSGVTQEAVTSQGSDTTNTTPETVEQTV